MHPLFHLFGSQGLQFPLFHKPSPCQFLFSPCSLSYQSSTNQPKSQMEDETQPTVVSIQLFNICIWNTLNHLSWKLMKKRRIWYILQDQCLSNQQLYYEIWGRGSWHCNWVMLIFKITHEEHKKDQGKHIDDLAWLKIPVKFLSWKLRSVGGKGKTSSVLRWKMCEVKSKWAAPNPMNELRLCFVIRLHRHEIHHLQGLLP